MIDCYWSFYNQRSQARYDGFKTVQARGFVTAIPADQTSDWIVWKEGYPDWQPLLNFRELFAEQTEFTYSAESEFNLTNEEDYATDPKAQHPLENGNTMTNTKELSETDPFGRSPKGKTEETATGVLGGIVPEDEFINISTSHLELGRSPDIPRPDMRKSARYKCVVEVEIDIGLPKKIFTTSLDMSTGGILLNTHLPAAAKKTVRMTLKKASGKVEVTADNLLDKNGFPSRRYRFLTVDLPELLRTWLLSGL